MDSPTLNKPLQIVSVDSKTMSLSDGSQMQFMPNFPPPKSWQVDDVVELEELKMKMFRIVNRSQNKSQAQAMCIKGADVKSDSIVISKSMDGEYPKTHLYVEWMIEKLLSNTSKILLSDNSLWNYQRSSMLQAARMRSGQKDKSLKYRPLLGVLHSERLRFKLMV